MRPWVTSPPPKKKTCYEVKNYITILLNYTYIYIYIVIIVCNEKYY